MTPEHAFRLLIEEAERLPRKTSLRKAMIVGADFIRQMSGRWYPADREALLGDGYEDRLDKLEREEAL